VRGRSPLDDQDRAARRLDLDGEGGVGADIHIIASRRQVDPDLGQFTVLQEIIVVAPHRPAYGPFEAGPVLLSVAVVHHHLVVPRGIGEIDRRTAGDVAHGKDDRPDSANASAALCVIDGEDASPQLERGADLLEPGVDRLLAFLCRGRAC